MQSKLHPALAHLEVDSNSAALTICLWDNATSQTVLPYMVEALRVLLRTQRCHRVEPRGEIRYYYSDRIRSGIHFSPDIFSLFDIQTQTALYWVEDVTQLPYYEHSSPLRMILSWWLQSQGYQYVHAGAVSTAEQGALLVGSGGAGKSTAALACVGSSLKYISDDYCAIRVDPTRRVYSLYNTAKLCTQEDTARFRDLNIAFSCPASNVEKAVTFLADSYSDALRQAAPISVVLLVSHGDQRETVYLPIPASRVLKEMLPWTVLQLPNAGQKTTDLLKRLLQTMPCYEVNTGTDLSQIPTTILSILQTI